MKKKSRELILKGFTLVEVMVSVTVLAILLLLVYSIVNQVSGTWSAAGSKVAQFKEARVASESIAIRLSQATLNTYWGYDNPTLPSRYLPQSELHFVTGRASGLVAGGAIDYHPSHSVFFVAPLGYTEEDDLRDFTGLLNACGYYIEYGSDADYRPKPLQTAGSEERWRFRLMEYRQPTESFKIYDHENESEEQRYSKWHMDDSSGTNRPIAENIIALIIAPMTSREEAASEGKGAFDIAPNYEFDSREGAVEERHQLPPMIRIVMVAMDEASAIRLDFGPEPPSLFNPRWFGSISNEEDLLKDVARLESILISKDIKFRTFHSVVPLRAAKWVPNS